ncbi:MAG: YggS family pyridoxal phosphate-dependent enzyme [bacterium]
MVQNTVSIKENWQRIKERIDRAALRAGRSPEEITLVAVSKKQSMEKIRQAVDAGARVLGENYVQEAQEKIPLLTGYPIEWHLIGHLQSNKVKLAVPLFTLIHTVDSLELARLISQRAQREGKIQSILIQINMAGEESKSGIAPQEAGEMAGQIIKLPHLSLEGLMTIPPEVDDPEKVRPYFAGLRDVRDQLNRYLPSPLKTLSMGMSHDFEVAIEEGATLVRVGSAIFGPRD